MKCPRPTPYALALIARSEERKRIERIRKENENHFKRPEGVQGFQCPFLLIQLQYNGYYDR